MTEELRDKFERYDRDVLLHKLAFEMYQFSPEAQSELKAVGDASGIDESAIRTYRDRIFFHEELDTNCDQCHEAITLNREDLLKGEFDCPACRAHQLIVYPKLSSNPAENVLYKSDAEDVNGETDAIADLSDEATRSALQRHHDRMTQIISESKRPAKAADDELPQEVPEVFCDSCHTSLRDVDSFILGESLVCEACFEKNRGRAAVGLPGTEAVPSSTDVGFPFWFLGFLLVAFLVVQIFELIVLAKSHDSLAIKLGIGNGVVLIFLLYQLIRRKRSFRLNFTLYYFSVGVLLLLNLLSSPAVYSIHAVKSSDTPLGMLLRHMIWGGFWIWYIGKSEKMRAVFVN